MDRINGADTVDIGGGKRGFQDEDLLGPQTGTEVTAEWLNMVQEEICGVIEGEGIELDPADWGQLAKALKLMGLSKGARARRWMAVISMETTAPPGAPAEGDAYLIPAGATDAWAANVGKIAEWSGTAWAYISPPDGHGISLPDGRVFERVAGSYVEKIAKDVQSGKWNFAVAAGTATVMTATLSPAPASYDDLLGAPIRLDMTAIGVSGAAPTVNLNGLGAISAITQDGEPLIGGEMQGIAQLVYDGTYFQVVGSVRRRNFFLEAAVQSVGANNVVITNYGSKTLALPESSELAGSITIGAEDAGVYVLNTFLACSPPINNLTSLIQVNGVRVSANATTDAANSEGVSTTAVIRLSAGDVIRALSWTPAGANIIAGRFSGHRLSL